MVKNHGDKYGMGDLAKHIKYDPKAKNHYSVDDAGAREQIFAKRKDANVNAMMGAEYAKENQQILQRKLGQKPGPTELYFAHFLGPDTAAKFLAARKAGQGGSSAAAMLPDAAANNHSVFYTKAGQPRSLDEVYKLFQAKIEPTADAYNRARVG